MKKIVALLIGLGLNISCFASDEVTSEKDITAFGINAKMAKHIVSYSHYKLIGICTWVVYNPFPKLKTSLALEQYIPDITVAVYNRPQSNPWSEARVSYESNIAIKGYNKAYKLLTGDNLGFGEESRQRPRAHIDETRMRIVDALGTPSIFRWGETHTPITMPYGAYYLSQADSYGDRSEVAEAAKLLTKPWLLFNHEIGTLTENWGSEFPRLMTVSNPSRFKASVVAALHAADIATNGGGVHVVNTVSNSCGHNCWIEPVVFDKDGKSSFWQEVYPSDRLVTPGVSQSNQDEVEDDKKGHGNYVFVVWRKYRGCVQREGHYLWSTTNVTPTSKR